MSRSVSSHDVKNRTGGTAADEVLKGIVVLGGIALGLLLLKSILESAEDED